LGSKIRVKSTSVLNAIAIEIEDTLKSKTGIEIKSGRSKVGNEIQFTEDMDRERDQG
jgi:hypothetical protein